MSSKGVRRSGPTVDTRPVSSTGEAPLRIGQWGAARLAAAISRRQLLRSTARFGLATAGLPLVGSCRPPTAMSWSAAPSTTPSHDAVQVEQLGQPFEKPAYARNVWDIQRFGTRLYFGHGNSSNNNPSPNAGPIDVISYDAVGAAFQTEFTVDDEQINTFRVLNARLYIPGHDAREGWELGNFYRLEQPGWKKYRTIPNAVHVFDIYAFDGKLFAALSPQPGSTNICLSDDDGLSWRDITYSARMPNIRIFSLFELNGALYGSTGNFLLRYDGGDVFTPLSSTKDFNLFPDAPDDGLGRRVERPVNFLDQLIYIGAIPSNDMQWDPIGLYAAQDPADVRVLSIPGGGLMRDLVVDSVGRLCVLSDRRLADGQHLIRVHASTDLQRWTELLRFQADTFARSFEELGNDFYFGLGCDTHSLRASTGTILRVKGFSS
jgi:hypothetical protein